MTGLDKKVSDFVLDHPKTQEFWKAWTQLLDTVMPGYIAEGKPQLYRHRLHGRPAPQRCHCRGHGPLPGRRSVS